MVSPALSWLWCSRTYLPISVENFEDQQIGPVAAQFFDKKKERIEAWYDN